MARNSSQTGIPMKQAISGVSPPEASEVTIMTVYPTIAAHPVGCTIGQLCANRTGFGTFFTIGKVFALLSIPLAMGLFFFDLLPYIGRRYRLTNRRVIVETALPVKEQRSVSLADFDTVEVVILPGQAWYPAGELIFRKGKIESFRLSGVSRPETFRRTCLEAQLAALGVRKALAAV
jgi:hypothetical protein